MVDRVLGGQINCHRDRPPRSRLHTFVRVMDRHVVKRVGGEQLLSRRSFVQRCQNRNKTEEERTDCVTLQTERRSWEQDELFFVLTGNRTQKWQKGPLGWTVFVLWNFIIIVSSPSHQTHITTVTLCVILTRERARNHVRNAHDGNGLTLLQHAFGALLPCHPKEARGLGYCQSTVRFGSDVFRVPFTEDREYVPQFQLLESVYHAKILLHNWVKSRQPITSSSCTFRVRMTDSIVSVVSISVPVELVSNPGCDAECLRSNDRPDIMYIRSWDHNSSVHFLLLATGNVTPSLLALHSSSPTAQVSISWNSLASSASKVEQVIHLEHVTQSYGLAFLSFVDFNLTTKDGLRSSPTVDRSPGSFRPHYFDKGIWHLTKTPVGNSERISATYQASLASHTHNGSVQIKVLLSDDRKSLDLEITLDNFKTEYAHGQFGLEIVLSSNMSVVPGDDYVLTEKAVAGSGQVTSYDSEKHCHCGSAALRMVFWLRQLTTTGKIGGRQINPGMAAFRIRPTYDGYRLSWSVVKEPTDRKFCGSNPTRTSRLHLSRLGLPSSISAIELRSLAWWLVTAEPVIHVLYNQMMWNLMYSSSPIPFLLGKNKQSDRGEVRKTVHAFSPMNPPVHWLVTRLLHLTKSQNRRLNRTLVRYFYGERVHQQYAGLDSMPLVVERWSLANKKLPPIGLRLQRIIFHTSSNHEICSYPWWYGIFPARNLPLSEPTLLKRIWMLKFLIYSRKGNTTVATTNNQQVFRLRTHHSRSKSTPYHARVVRIQNRNSTGLHFDNTDEPVYKRFIKEHSANNFSRNDLLEESVTHIGQTSRALVYHLEEETAIVVDLFYSAELGNVQNSTIRGSQSRNIVIIPGKLRVRSEQPTGVKVSPKEKTTFDLVDQCPSAERRCDILVESIG
ncbi:hypothetical protein CLF_111450 [Clonorchis sinensis]|uniref:Uncharacterized protein n=1 Tax=Clonorchis sinensis TaxID=79923 RepID=H2KT23_CLOSI|nr:hypothetical protein CLF_111450 [Clonorchis sinensis]